MSSYLSGILLPLPPEDSISLEDGLFNLYTYLQSFQAAELQEGHENNILFYYGEVEAEAEATAEAETKNNINYNILPPPVD